MLVGSNVFSCPCSRLARLGKNYLDHIAEVKAKDSSDTNNSAIELPKYPQLFTKAPECVVAPNDFIESHKDISKYLDYEAELAVIIGLKGRDIARENAMDHVFGYTIANDVTARDIQRHHVQFFKGKTLDRTCPLGPYIVPKQDILDPMNLFIKLWLNDQLMQNSNTSKMIFDIKDIIVHLSRGFTLLPGDIILTGTPEGVGYARKPPVTLKPNDRVRIEIENLGILENHVL